MNMKKNRLIILIVAITFGLTVLSGCGADIVDPGDPPAEVVNGENRNTESSGSEIVDTENNTVEGEANTVMDDAESGDIYEGEILTNAISVRIGRDGMEEWNIDMYHNDAALTMLDYLSGSAMLFPTYTYDEDGGFVAQSVRGNYTRDDEQTITDVKTGELYLLNGGQLRFYFKDMEGANITATPIGYYTDVEGLTEAVQEAYTSNLDDTWGVDVYFWITKADNLV